MCGWCRDSHILLGCWIDLLLVDLTENDTNCSGYVSKQNHLIWSWSSLPIQRQVEKHKEKNRHTRDWCILLNLSIWDSCCCGLLHLWRNATKKPVKQTCVDTPVALITTLRYNLWDMLGCCPSQDAIVTTRIITFVWFRDPKSSFATGILEGVTCICTYKNTCQEWCTHSRIHTANATLDKNEKLGEGICFFSTSAVAIDVFFLGISMSMRACDYFEYVLKWSSHTGNKNRGQLAIPVHWIHFPSRD